MEESFKKDVLRELRAGDGRILLHDEVEERPGVFSLIPIWEEVSEDDIMTPRNVYELMTKEGFHVGSPLLGSGLVADCCFRSTMPVLPWYVLSIGLTILYAIITFDIRPTSKHHFQMPFNRCYSVSNLALAVVPQTLFSTVKWGADVSSCVVCAFTRLRTL
jgi:hypothetical protein